MIYILALVFLVLTVGFIWLDQALSGSTLDDMVIPMYEQQMDSYNLDNAEEATVYVSLKNIVEINKIFKEKNIDYYSPEGYYLYNDISNMMSEQLTAKYVEKNEEKANELQVQLDEAIKSLDNYDWKANIEKDIALYRTSLESEEITEEEKSVINETIKVLQYRLDNNIPKSFRTGSTDLDNYLGSLAQYQQMNKNDSTYVDKSKLYQKKQLEAEVEEGKYKLEHKLYKNSKDSDTAQYGFLNAVGSLSIFITVCVLMVSGSIISEEYNKGTIKQLLTRPYTRTKIFTSKLLATFITVVLFILFTAVVQSLTCGIMTNSFGTLNDPIVHYNVSTHSIVVYNTITESLATFGAILPAILILMTFTLFVSILTGQTATSVVLGFVLFFIPSLFSLLIDRVALLSYLPIFNWDLTTYLYGGISPYKYMTFGKAIVVDIITIIALIVASIIFFNKKDIKNQ
jgi:ABC-2 type transport system permease protein